MFARIAIAGQHGLLVWLLSIGAGCSTVRPPADAETLLLDIPAIRQRPDRCGPAALQAVYAYWGRHETEPDVAARIYSRDANGALPGMLVVDARKQGLRAAFGPNEAEAWIDILDRRVPVISLITLSGVSHFVVIQGYAAGDSGVLFRVNDGSGRLGWVRGTALTARADGVSIYVWPVDYDFDPPPLPVHDAG